MTSNLALSQRKYLYRVYWRKLYQIMNSIGFRKLQVGKQRVSPLVASVAPLKLHKLGVNVIRIKRSFRRGVTLFGCDGFWVLHWVQAVISVGFACIKPTEGGSENTRLYTGHPVFWYFKVLSLNSFAALRNFFSILRDRIVIRLINKFYR